MPNYNNNQISYYYIIVIVYSLTEAGSGAAGVLKA